MASKAFLHKNSILALLFALIAFYPLPTHPEAAEKRKLEQSSEHSDLVGGLYSSRISFNKTGVPLIGVGIMDAQESIEFALSSPVKVTYFSPEKKTKTLGGGARIVAKKGHTSLGEAIVHVVVATVDQRNKSKIREIVARWEKKGVSLTILRVGAIIALGGEIINNVSYHLVAGSFHEEENAKKLQQKLRLKHHADAHLFRRIQRLPQGQIVLHPSGGLRPIHSNNILLIESLNDSAIGVPRCEYSKGFPDHGFERRDFQGTLYIAIDRHGKLALGNLISFEKLLEGTVPSEMYSSAPMETLKAQSIAARGQLLAKLGTRHLADPFHICASMHCQVYQGIKAKNRRASQAVKETRGEFAITKGRLVDTVYSASAGGFTENNENVWHQTPDENLRGKLDGKSDARFAEGITESNLDAFLDNPPTSFSRGTGFNENRYRWKRSFSATEIKRLVNEKYDVGDIIDLKPIRRGVSGRLIELVVIGEEATVIVSRELAIRRLFDNLSSGLFRIQRERDKSGKITRYIFKGAGFGHGVGMCQTGAIGRAKAGQSYREILQHYYGNFDLKKLY